MKSAQKNKSSIILVTIVIVLLLVAVGVLAFLLLKKEDSAQSVTSDNGTPILAYASEGVTIVDDESALQKAVNEMVASVEEGTMALKYKQRAYSEDGKIFSCSIANSERNTYDMFIAVFADSELTDQLFLSGLIRPGEKFESITLERTLELGTHEVIVAFTQVEHDLTTIHSQSFVKMEFIVK